MRGMIADGGSCIGFEGPGAELDGLMIIIKSTVAALDFHGANLHFDRDAVFLTGATW